MLRSTTKGLAALELILLMAIAKWPAYFIGQKQVKGSLKQREKLWIQGIKTLMTPQTLMRLIMKLYLPTKWQLIKHNKPLSKSEWRKKMHNSHPLPQHRPPLMYPPKPTCVKNAGHNKL
jgi:hypothetical protein